VDDVPSSYLKDHRTIYGYVERVIDGDTIRVRHCPGYVPWWYGGEPPREMQQKTNGKPKRVALSATTLSIRIYGVDCPETAKPQKGTPAQPFANEATAFTSERVLYRMVRITFLRRDQYRRAVAEVSLLGPNRPLSTTYYQQNQSGKAGGRRGFLERVFGRRAPSRDLSIALAREGLAELYVGGGAEYHDKRDQLEAAIAAARSDRRGIWSISEKNRVSTAEFKRNGGGGVVVAAKQEKQFARPGQHSSLAVSPIPRGGGVVLWGPKRLSKEATKTNKEPTKSRKLGKCSSSCMDAVVTGLEFAT
jgi:endonuclease YncB( thermonuclease family)